MSRLNSLVSSALAACSAALMVTWFAVACNIALADEQLSTNCACYWSIPLCLYDNGNSECTGGCMKDGDCEHCDCYKIYGVLDCECEPIN